MTDTAQPLLAHLTELRTRLLWALLAFGAAAVVSFLFVKPIYGFLVEPLARAMGPGDTNRLIYTDLTEAFFTYMKVALFSGFFITCPFLLWQVWHFIAPGLLDKEKRTVLPFLIATPALFFIGAAFVYYLILPIAWPFFLSFQSGGVETALPIQLEARVGAMRSSLSFPLPRC